MFKTLFKRPTVVQIHKEFDEAEEKCLQEAEILLKFLDITTENRLENKAKILKELGFINSEPVKQYNQFSENQNIIKNKYNATKEQVEFIHYLKTKYPFQKFITVDELERICNKYNLIHAPVANYIKDIPEKNVLEIKNTQKLDLQDCYQQHIKIIITDKDNSIKGLTSSEEKKVRNQGIIFTKKELDECTEDWQDIDKNKLYSKKFNKEVTFRWRWGGDKKIEIINKSGFFIAAPKSHFNLTGLSKKSKYGFFNVTITEVKDPVVFEYCDKEVVRIISKWGTEDDQSYLDSSLVNEILN